MPLSVPRPIPSIKRISDKAADAAAPATMAPHDTALACARALSGYELDRARPRPRSSAVATLLGGHA